LTVTTCYPNESGKQESLIRMTATKYSMSFTTGALFYHESMKLAALYMSLRQWDKKYEFGSKVCFGVTKKSGIIVAVKSFAKNLYDGDTLEDTIKQMERVLNYKPELAICDIGFRGRKVVEGVKILTPENQRKRLSETEKKKNRKRNLRRSAIEPIIGHVKNDFRMARNFLKHTLGDEINAIMAAAAFNFKKWMRTVGVYFRLVFFRLCALFWGINPTPEYAKIG